MEEKMCVSSQRYSNTVSISLISLLLYNWLICCNCSTWIILGLWFYTELVTWIPIFKLPLNLLAFNKLRCLSAINEHLKSNSSMLSYEPLLLVLMKKWWNINQLAASEMLCNDGLQVFDLVTVAFAGVLIRCLSCLTACNVFSERLLVWFYFGKITSIWKWPPPVTIIFDFFTFFCSDQFSFKKETSWVTCLFFSVSSTSPPADRFSDAVSGFSSNSGSGFLDFAYFLARKTFMTSGSSKRNVKRAELIILNRRKCKNLQKAKMEKRQHTLSCNKPIGMAKSKSIIWPEKLAWHE